jgi:hypothetical protein
MDPQRLIRLRQIEHFRLLDFGRPGYRLINSRREDSRRFWGWALGGSRASLAGHVRGHVEGTADAGRQFREATLRRHVGEARLQGLGTGEATGHQGVFV